MAAAASSSSSGPGGSSPAHAPPGGGAGGGSGGGGGGPYNNRSRFGDTTLTKVFVGGLAWETPSEGLRQHFEAYGEILEAVVINDRETGRSKGYGFVSRFASSSSFATATCRVACGAPLSRSAASERSVGLIRSVLTRCILLLSQVIFRDPDSAARAVENPNPVIAGRRANCNIAALGPPRPQQQQARGERPEEPNQINAPPASLFLCFFTFPCSLARQRMCMAVISGALLAPAAVRRFTG
jgi:hypothetical protein